MLEAAWDPAYAERSPLFAPLRPFAQAFAACTGWPAVAAWDRAFAMGPWAAAAGVRFVPAPPAPPRRRARARGAAPIDPALLYDGRVLAGEVPSRERSWHDFLNAHVWSAFPRAKRALHARQHAMLVERLEPAACALPRHRTREQDVIAMLDEGGALLLAPAGPAPRVERELAARAHGAVLARVAADEVALLVFGHAVYEALVVSPRPLELAVRIFALPALPRALAERVALADALLAGWLVDRGSAGAVARHPTLALPPEASSR